MEKIIIKKNTRQMDVCMKKGNKQWNSFPKIKSNEKLKLNYCEIVNFVLTNIW